MIHPDTIEIIFDRSRIEEVVGDFISLKKSGSNYKGCCPFHDEKTPSFMVSPAKGIYKCFGCGKGGNAVSFVMDHERLSYVDALKFLAKKYHIEIVETHVSEEDKQKKDIRESLMVVNNFAKDYFCSKLTSDSKGRAIGLSYFKERGFTDEIIEKFQLGYSPEQKNAFTEEAIKQGYKIEFLEKTGLTVVGEDYMVDRFRGRVMFPIHSLSGNVIGFGGRIVGNDPDKKLAKYLNSPESELYNKSKTLYGIYYARTEIVKKDECILVEGYTDVMSMHQSGLENVVASSGTSLTIEQIQLIKRFTNNILVIYDGDSAGIKASFRGINMILEQGLNVKVLLLPDGEDPDSFAKKNNADDLRAYIRKNRTDFITFKTRLFEQESQSDPVERAKLINDIVKSIAIIPDKITQSVYVSECSSILKISETLLFNQVQTLQTGIAAKQSVPTNVQTPPVPIAKPQQATEEIDKIYYCEKEILRLLITYGSDSVMFPFQKLEMRVDEYMHAQIVEGEMMLQIPLLQKVFQEYYAKKQEVGDIQKYLVNHEDREIVEIVADLWSVDKSLSSIWYKKENVTETEKDKLAYVLLGTIGEYKRCRLEKEVELYMQSLKKAGANEAIEISGKIRIIKQRISNILKELKHVS